MRFLFIFFLLIATPATADDKNFNAVGIDISGNTQSFDESLWHDITAKKYYALLETIPNTITAAERQLLRNLLVFEAKPPKGSDGSEPSYLAFRMQKLIALGYPQDAVALYQRAQKYTLPDDVHKAGILASFLNNKSGLACLDYRAARQKGDMAEWSDITKLCDEIDAEFKDSKTKTISLADFDTLSLEAKAIAMAHNSFTLKSNDSFALTDRPAPLTLFFINHKNNDDASLDFKTTAMLEHYGLKPPSKNNPKFEKPVGFAAYNQRQTITAADADKDDRKKAFKQILTQIHALPPSFLRPLFEKNYAESIDLKLSPTEIFDLTAVAAALEIESPYVDSTYEAHPGLPALLLKKKSVINPQSLQNWLNDFCFDTQTFNPLFCLTFYSSAQEKLGEKLPDEIKKQLYGKFFTLTSYVNYATSIDGILGLYPAKPLKNNKGYNLLYLLSSGSSDVNALSFPLFETIMELAENDVLTSKTAYQLSLKHLVSLKATTATE